MGSAIWVEKRIQDSFCYTTPTYPGYEIEKFDDEPFYRVWAPVLTPVMPSTAADFREAEGTIREHFLARYWSQTGSPS
jgi:hypothetical protein